MELQGVSSLKDRGVRLV